LIETRTFTDTSPAAASTVVSPVLTLDRLDHFEQAMIVAVLTGGTGGTLDVYLQFFDGYDWVDYLHFAQLTAGAAAVVKAIPITRTSQRLAPVTVGRNATPALAADTCLGGDFGDKFRAVFVAGVSTSAGAAQVIRVVGTKLER
jgi:hypothetical protein